jgi:antitoxin MazE
MQTRVQRWGNSLAIRIPKAFADQAGVAQHSLVDLSIVEGQLVVTAVTPPSPSLDELLTGVTDDNLHGEATWGDAVGREAW